MSDITFKIPQFKFPPEPGDESEYSSRLLDVMDIASNQANYRMKVHLGVFWLNDLDNPDEHGWILFYHYSIFSQAALEQFRDALCDKLSKAAKPIEETISYLNQW